MTKTAKKKAESKEKAEAQRAEVAKPRHLFKADAKAARKREAAAKPLGFTPDHRPSVVAIDTARREGLTPASDRYRWEWKTNSLGRKFVLITLDGFRVGEFPTLAAAQRMFKAATPREDVQPAPSPAKSVIPEPAAKPKRGEALRKVIGGEIAREKAKAAAAERLTAAAIEIGAVKAPAAPVVKDNETPEERRARLTAAARKAWETRKANGWKHPNAKPTSPLIEKIDAQLAESKKAVKAARETFKALDAKKAEKREAAARTKRVEKREKAKRQAAKPATRLPQLEAILGAAFTG